MTTSSVAMITEEQIPRTTQRVLKRIFNLDKIFKAVFRTPASQVDSRHIRKITMIKKPEAKVSLNLKHYDLPENGMSLHTHSDELSEYDMLVYSAVQSIYVHAFEETRRQHVPMTVGMIYRAMTANDTSKPTHSETERIHESIDKMRQIFVTVSPADNMVAVRPDIKKIDGAMISAYFVEGILQGKKTEYWIITMLPLLYIVSDTWNQIARIDIEKLNCHTRFTLEIGTVREFLVERIEKMRGKWFKNNGILMATVYGELLGVDIPTAKQREKISARIRTVLDAFVSNGYIKGYSFDRVARNRIRKIDIRL